MSPKDVRALAVQSKEREIQLMTSPEVMMYPKPIVGTPCGGLIEGAAKRHNRFAPVFIRLQNCC